ncbi:MAG: NYN domain-containing protein [Candidatus Taylorbacteria bacterium]
MKKIDVFVDLEGVGRIEGYRDFPSKIKFIANGLTDALCDCGFTISSTQFFACYKRPREVIPPGFQTKVCEVAAAFRCSMHWSNCIADTALIARIEYLLVSNALSEAVMIIASDHDFIAIIDKLRANGRYVLVSGTNMNKRLQNHAHKVVPLNELLDVTKNGETGKYDAHFSSPLWNPIPLP